MNKEMFISSSPHETKVAVCEDGQLVEVYFERDTDVGLVGGIYKGRVSRVLPGMQSAFVNIGLERDAFLYVSDFSLQDQEEFEGLLEDSPGRGAAIEVETQTDNGAAATGDEAIPAQSAEASQPASGAPESREPLDGGSATGASPENAGSEARAAGQGTPQAGSRFKDGETDFRHRSHRGRRRHRRGRGDSDERRPPRQVEHKTVSEDREPEPPKGFELLPGETLAKYGHVDREDSPAAQRASEPVGEASAPEAAREPSVQETESPKVEVQAVKNPETPEAGNEPGTADRGRSSDSVSSPVPSPDDPSASSTVEESPVAEAKAQEDLSPGTRSASLPEVADESVPETSSADSEASAKAPESEGSPEEQLSPSSENPPESAERSTTLREPHTHPRSAPRRSRRGRRRGGRNPRRHNGNETAPAARATTQQAGHGLQISELLKEGQEIIVQIAKEPLGTKGARITSHVALPGRYVVYMPTISHIGVSRKIASERERLRLRNIIVENRGALTGGFIVRTAGEGRSEEEIKADLRFLTTLWNEIRNKAERVKAPSLLYRDLDLAQRLMRDLVTADFKSIWLDNESDYERVVEFVNRLQPTLVGCVKLHTRDTSLFEEHGVQAEIEKALRPKVWLKSGGYIVINQTEALVAIDVNTGKYVGKTNRLEDTIVKTNVDAVNEIVRQIRVRDLGGIIVVDFIDMDERRNRNKVVQALEEALRLDRAPTKVLSFNDFGLVAVTRKRVKQSLERTLCDPCTYCNGSGWIKSVSSICYEILSEARKMSREIEGKTVTLRVNPEVALALKSKDGTLVAEIEMLTHKDLIIKSDPTIHQERFEIF
ncbi:MAG TPA: Rne/Rng family ribonuclease [Terriglobia bacterium]|nr:Rne/Rng family ribonuclease [Terriglobia bacterium]